jgi:hypothetical protein
MAVTGMTVQVVTLYIITLEMVVKKELYKQYVFMEEDCSNCIVMMTVSGGYYFHYIYITFMLPALEKQCHKKM